MTMAWRAVAAMLGGAMLVAVAPAGGHTTPPRSPLPPRPGPWVATGGGTQQPLWPAGVPLQRPESTASEATGLGSRDVAGRPWTYVANVARPTMTIYRPRGASAHTALVVLPGGGYEVVAIDLEGTEVCDWATARGITCIVLKYRVPQYWHRDGIEVAPDVLLPLQDAQRAVSLVRAQAAALDIDPHRVGVVGFSAGGHLAAAISNAGSRTYPETDAVDHQPWRPDFAMLLYPGHLRDRDTMVVAPWLTIRSEAPSTLLIHAIDDPTDAVEQSLTYAAALRRVKVPVEMHLYADGRHAFGLRPTAAPITRWPAVAEQWLRTIDMLPTAADQPRGGPAARQRSEQ